MDLKKLEVTQNPVAYTIMNPITGEETESKIYLFSPDSSYIASYERTLQKEVLASSKISEEDIIEQVYKKVVIRCIDSWDNIEWEGGSLECNEKNKAMLLDNLPWLYRQLKMFLDDAKVFFTNS